MRLGWMGCVIMVLGCGSADADEALVANAPVPIEQGMRAAVGAPAPDFVLPAVDGTLVRLSDFAGQTVVLEWFNPGCPFVKEVYNEDKMTDLAARWAAQGVQWLAINSGAAGKQGSGVSTNRRAADRWDIPYPVLLDESGAVGRTYGAQTTPHMYIIGPDGNLAFSGAFSNAPLGNVDGEQEVNHVDVALEALREGQPVENTAPKPWGCSVKYGS